MIRRITKNNDLKDLIKSCPTGVIDDIYSIRYYIAGNPDDEIEPTFSKVNNHLEVVIPSSMLENLGNGILMRRSLYKVVDPEYPDGYYNLEFIDNMNIWLGEEEVSPFVPSGEYLTASDLKTVNNQSLIGNGNIQINASVPDYYATKSWVSSQGYLTSVVLDGYATESWVSSQGYLTSVVLDGYATESWVISTLSSYTPDMSSYATKSWVSEQGYITSSSLSGYATESWVSSQGFLTSVPSEYVTQSWVSEQGYITSSSLSGYATESWVSSQGYLTSAAMSGYTTESWVESYVSYALLGYGEDNYVIREDTLNERLSYYLEKESIWTGTQSQWDQLPSSQKEWYIIALVTE